MINIILHGLSRADVEKMRLVMSNSAFARDAHVMAVNEGPIKVRRIELITDEFTSDDDVIDLFKVICEGATLYNIEFESVEVKVVCTIPADERFRMSALTHQFIGN